MDPEMSEYEKQTIDMMRQVFARPFYTVYKIKQDSKNETGLTWNVDYCIASGAHEIAVIIKALPDDTTVANLDQRMRDAYAIFSLMAETKNGGLYDKVHWRLLIVKDDVMSGLGSKAYGSYRYAFESLSVRIVWASKVPDELKRVRHEMEESGL
jgi:hypothetical protein